MASWISVYCTRSVAAITPEQLAQGLRDKDAAAPAGVDYLTLAEQYDVDEAKVGPALAALRVRGEPGFEQYDVSYGARRPVRVHRWASAQRVAAELAEVRARAPKATVAKRLAATAEVIGIELGASQLADFGVVVANEIARYLAQKGAGVIVDLQGCFVEIRRGGFVDL